MRIHSCTASYISSLRQKTFHQQLPWVAQKMGETLETNIPDHLSAVTWQHMAWCCRGKIRHQYWAVHNVLTSWLVSSDTNGGCNMRHWWLFAWIDSALQVGLGDPRITSESLFLQMPVCRILWVLVSWNCLILCLPSLFHDGCSGPSFHLQSLWASESHHLLFPVVREVLGRHSHVLPSIQESPVLTAALQTLCGTAIRHR
jgi:hypothetical protein